MAFPSSPTNGQQATVNGITYSYNSTTRSWRRLTLSNVVADTGTFSTKVTTSNLATGPINANGAVTVSSLTSNGSITGTTGTFGSGVITTTLNANANITVTNLTVNTNATISSNLVASNYVISGTGIFYSNGTAFSSGSAFTYTANTAPPTSGNLNGDQWYNTSNDL